MKLSRALLDRVVAVIPTGGICLKQITVALNIHISGASIAVGQLVKEGAAFKTRIRDLDRSNAVQVWAFPTAAARDAAKAANDDACYQQLRARRRLWDREQYATKAAEREILAIRRAEDRAAAKLKLQEEKEHQARARLERRAMTAAEKQLSLQRARLGKEAATAEKQRQKIEAKTLQTRLRKETRALGLLSKAKGTGSPTPKQPTGPAYLPGDLDMNGKHVQRFETPPPRFAPDPSDTSWRLLSACKYGEYIAPPASCAARAAGGGV